MIKRQRDNSSFSIAKNASRISYVSYCQLAASRVQNRHQRGTAFKERVCLTNFVRIWQCYRWSKSLPATSLSFLASTSRALSDSIIAVVSSLDRSNSPLTGAIDGRFEVGGMGRVRVLCAPLLLRRNSRFLVASFPLLPRLNVLLTLGWSWPTDQRHFVIL